MATKLLAHRGANRRAPQNTLPAFDEAIRRGAEGVEFDVQMTADGKLVICHNFTIDATSTGHGFIHKMTYDTLRSYDFGTKFSREFAGTKIPTLTETLACVRDMDVLNVELKPAFCNRVEFVEKTLSEVRRFGLSEKVIFSSFDFELLLLVKQADPTLKTGLLYDPLKDECYDRNILKFWKDGYLELADLYKADALHPYFTLTNYPKSYVDKCHKAGLMVNVWGISDEKTLEEYKQKNLDIIITDCF